MRSQSGRIQRATCQIVAFLNCTKARCRHFSLFEIWLNPTAVRNSSSSANQMMTRHIPYTSMTMFLWSHGDRLLVGNIQYCLRAAASWVAWQLANFGDGPVEANHFVHRSVQIFASPQARMTRIRFAQIVSDLGVLVESYDWSWASHIVILDAYLGQLGSLDMSFRAPRPGISAFINSTSSFTEEWDLSTTISTNRENGK